MTDFYTKDINRLYAEVFGSPAGKVVLSHILYNAMLISPPFQPAAGAHAEVYKRGISDHALQVAQRAGVKQEDVARALAGLVPTKIETKAEGETNG